MAEAMEEPKPQAIRIFVDADACPVKPEIYRVAERYALRVYVVANAFMAVPRNGLIERVVVGGGPDIADDWIAERAGANDIVITADIPLAGRCVRKGATVIGPTGKPFTDDSIGMALATRDLLIQRSSLGGLAGVIGASAMVVDQLFARDAIGLWIEAGEPSRVPDLATARSG